MSQRKKKNKKNNQQQSNSTPEAVVSSLNVNAVEFVPSSMARENIINSVFLPDHTENLNISACENRGNDYYQSTDEQENASYPSSTVDPLPFYGYDEVCEQMHEYPRMMFPRVCPNVQHLNLFHYPVNGGSTFFEQPPPQISVYDAELHNMVLVTQPLIGASNEGKRETVNQIENPLIVDDLTYGTAWDENIKNLCNLQLCLNSISTGSTASCLPEYYHSNRGFQPEDPNRSFIPTPDIFMSERQTIDCTLNNKYNTTSNPYIRETSPFGNANEYQFSARNNLLNPHYDCYNTAAGLTAPYPYRYQPNCNQSFDNSEFPPWDPILTAMAEGILSDGQQANEVACDPTLLPRTRNTWENQTNPQYSFNYEPTGSIASCLPEHNQVIAKRSATPEDVIVKGLTMDSMPTNEDNTNVMETKTNYEVQKHAGISTEKPRSGEEAPNIVQGNLRSSKKNIRSQTKDVSSKKEHVNVVFVGHVDAGKSTIGGHVMLLTGMVDKRAMEKFKIEAKLKSREAWYMSWALDTNQEERDKGKTVETGRGHFETDTKHFTILDAPGHKSFVPSMICGAAQADIAVLVLSARQNEFESGFDKGGQTRDHAILVKAAGVKVLIVLVNKMDDPTVEWSEERFMYCRDKTVPFLKKLGFASNNVYFLPVSGQIGHGLKTPTPTDICPWFKGPSFIECLDNLPPIERDFVSPFVMPVVEKFKDKGTVVMGKIEVGTTYVSNNLLLMPNKVAVTVDKIWSDDKEVTLARAGENVKLKLKGIEEEDISTGFVLCDILKPITVAKIFDAKLHILEVKSIICPGFYAMMHTQCVVEEVQVIKLICSVDPKTNVKSMIGKLKFVTGREEVILRIQCSGLICLTTFKEFSQLGKFTLRSDNKVFAFGTVLKIIQ